MVRRAIYRLLSIFLVLSLIVGAIGCTTENATNATQPQSANTLIVSPLAPKIRLKVATTTSLYDTGLWSYLEPMFEEKYNVEMDILSLGSGPCFEYAKRGDVDVIIIHDKPNELIFVSDNYGVERIPFAYNYFLIVGPASDPAGIKDLSPEAAFKKLMETGSGTFISRGDKSGTHSKEQTIWKNAGFDYATVEKAGAWYIEAGQGMGPTLLMASEKQAYTLTDMGTYITYKSRLELVPIIVAKGATFLNVYSVIPVNPQKVTTVKNLDMANNLVSFLTMPEIQELMGNYGVKEYGLQLFAPCAGAEPTQ